MKWAVWAKWVFLFLELIIPVCCIVFGALADKVAAGKINYWIGYRSARSIASREAWEFANRLAGKIMLRAGIIMASISLIATLVWLFLPDYIITQWYQLQGTVSIALTLAQTLVIVLIIPWVEKKLKEKFD